MKNEMKNEWYQGKSKFVKQCGYECDYEIDDSWQDFFKKEEVEILLGLIEDYLEREEKYYTKKGKKGDVYCYYPCKENVLRFASTDLTKVKHIIVGMDPYPTPDEETGHAKATGRAFEVDVATWNKGIEASLRNILKAVYYKYLKSEKKTKISEKEPKINEIRKEIENGTFLKRTPKDWFDYTEKEKRVMWLNSSLTVKLNEPGSHKAIWSLFMSELIKYVKKLREEKKIKEKIEWHLWGEDAKRLRWQIEDDKNVVHTACHPCKPGKSFSNAFCNDTLDLL